MRILLIRLSAFGDILFCTPLLAALRKKYPDADIDVAVDARFRHALEHHPAVSRQILVPGRECRQLIRSLRLFPAAVAVRQLLASLRSREYDVAIDLHSATTSTLTAIASRAKLRVGNRRQTLAWPFGKRCAINDGRESATLHSAETYIQYAVEAGLLLPSDVPESLRLTYYGPPHAKQNVDQFLAQHGFLNEEAVGINPGGSYPAKRWSEEGFARISEFLHQRVGRPILLFGSSAEAAIVQRIASASRVPTIDTTSLPLCEAFELIGRLRLFVTNDSAPLHIAAALGTPAVGLYGKINFAKYYPLSPSIISLRSTPTAGTRRHALRDPREDRQHFGQIAEETVCRACEQILLTAPLKP